MPDICPKCRIAFRDNDKVLWCPFTTCPKTTQHQPTEFQMKRFRVGEGFDPNSSNRST